MSQSFSGMNRALTVLRLTLLLSMTTVMVIVSRVVTEDLRTEVSCGFHDQASVCL